MEHPGKGGTGSHESWRPCQGPHGFPPHPSCLCRCRGGCVLGLLSFGPDTGPLGHGSCCPTTARACCWYWAALLWPRLRSAPVTHRMTSLGAWHRQPVLRIPAPLTPPWAQGGRSVPWHLASRLTTGIVLPHPPMPGTRSVPSGAGLSCFVLKDHVDGFLLSQRQSLCDGGLHKGPAATV